MPPRIAHLQRLVPGREAQLIRGYMERKSSGLLGAPIRAFYVLAGSLLYEYRVRCHYREGRRGDEERGLI